jgi:hypothetical protein
MRRQTHSISVRPAMGISGFLGSLDEARRAGITPNTPPPVGVDRPTSEEGAPLSNFHANNTNNPLKGCQN